MELQTAGTTKISTEESEVRIKELVDKGNYKKMESKLGVAWVILKPVYHHCSQTINVFTENFYSATFLHTLILFSRYLLVRIHRPAARPAITFSLMLSRLPSTRVMTWVTLQQFGTEVGIFRNMSRNFRVYLNSTWDPKCRTPPACPPGRGYRPPPRPAAAPPPPR